MSAFKNSAFGFFCERFMVICALATTKTANYGTMQGPGKESGVYVSKEDGSKVDWEFT